MYHSDVTPARLARVIAQMDRSADEVVVVMLGAEGAPDLDVLRAELNAADVPFFGGVFPAVLHDRAAHRHGAVVQTLPMRASSVVVQDLGAPDQQLPDALPTYRGASASRQGTALVLFDGLTSGLRSFLERLFNRLGDGYSYMGAGAGFLDAHDRPCLFSNEGVFKGAALVALVDCPSYVSARHGWRRRSGPLVATRTDRNVIHDLNWRRARPAYEEAVNEGVAGADRVDTFGDMAQRYPFGILRQGAEDVIRAPVAVDENDSLVCSADVDEDTVLYVLEGEKASLIEAARQAARASFKSSVRPCRGLLADCVSRYFFLGDAYGEELAAVAEVYEQHGLPSPEGVLSIGEVASSGRGLLEWYSWTVVSSVFYEA